VLVATGVRLNKIKSVISVVFFHLLCNQKGK
jgi:hypothetical protein